MKFKDNWTIKLMFGTGVALFLIILLITVAQAVCYWIPNWWEKEYTKWDSPNQVVGGMSLEDAVYVTGEMLEYCIDNRDSIKNVKAVVGGKEIYFFTDKVLLHLSDCKAVFLSVLKFRRIATLIIFILFALSYYLTTIKKVGKNYWIMLSRCYLFVTACFLTIVLLLALYTVIDFEKLFISFHMIAFDNYYWILDPNTDNLVNLMQTGVFFDFAITMFAIWLGVVILIAIPCFMNRKYKAD